MKLGKCILLATALVFSATGAMAQDGDSSADAASVAATVANSEGVIVRVPINAAGEENTSATELRVHDGATLSNADAATSAWANAIDMSSVPTIDGSSDSSTSGWYGNGRGNSGWQQPYYTYNHYTPTYNYYGNHYNYYRPTYCDRWSNGYGYRYYYYQRGWH